MPTILAQTVAVPELGPVPWILATAVFFYLFYKSTKDLWDRTAVAEASEYRKMLLGIPALVLLLAIASMSLVTVSLETLFGPAYQIVQYILGLMVPIALGVLAVLPIAFTVSLAKKELKFPGF